MKAWPSLPILSLVLQCSIGAQAAVATPPRAVVADVARDAKHPAANQQLLIASGGLGMNALLMRASGGGPKPTLLLLHGLPGNEQNLDLAQAIRRAGWNVLTLHYRGSWGSPGTFSVAGAIADGEAAMAFLMQPDNAAKYGVDTRRVLIGGHSLGGFVAALYAAAHPELPGLVLIDAANFGAAGKELQAHPEMRAEMIASLDDLGNSLAGTDAARLTDEFAQHGDDWDLMLRSPALALRPTLVIGASQGGGQENKELADAIRAQPKAKLTGLTLDSDHSFSDHRIALAAGVVTWLERQAAAKP